MATIWSGLELLRESEPLVLMSLTRYGCAPAVAATRRSDATARSFTLPSIRSARRERLRHPVDPRLLVPLRGHLLRLRPELDRAAAGDVADAELRVVPAAEAERLTRNRYADVHADHAGAGVLHNVAGDSSTLREDARSVAVCRSFHHVEYLFD